MSTNVALIVPTKFASQEVSTTAFPAPVPGDKEVLVRINSAGLNPIDWKIVKYGIYVQEFPTVLGSDGAGIITQVGKDVTKHKIGERVFFQAQIGNVRTSTFQQYAAIPEDLAVNLPENISFEQGATFGVAGGTAAVGLFKNLGLAPPWGLNADSNKGKTVLIWGASTSVGHLAVQLAVISGATVIATASPQYHDNIKKLGVTHVFDYRDPEAVKKIKDITADTLTLAFDTAGAASAQSAFDALSSKLPSTLALIASTPEDIKGAAENPHKTFARLFGSSYAHLELAVPFWNNFSKLLKDGKVVPHATKVIGGLDAIAAAQADQQSGKISSIKLIAKP